MSHCMSKPTIWHFRPVKTQISLGIRPVWSESSLSAWRKVWSLVTRWAHFGDSAQTRRMSRLIWTFALCTCHFFGFVMRRLEFQYVRVENGTLKKETILSVTSIEIYTQWVTYKVIIYKNYISERMIVRMFTLREWLSTEAKQCAQTIAKDPSFLHADSEGSYQTGRMPRLIRVFARGTVILLVLICRGLCAKTCPRCRQT